MNWLFWVLLILGLVFLFAPFAGLVAVAVKATFWLIGALLIIAAIVWAVATLSRPTMPRTMEPM
ncbi:MAG TPA: hypothetical protein VGL77_13625 [Armatimonadota bacterium]|jgi:hypothetical protein